MRALDHDVSSAGMQLRRYTDDDDDNGQLSLGLLRRTGSVNRSAWQAPRGRVRQPQADADGIRIDGDISYSSSFCSCCAVALECSGSVGTKDASRGEVDEGSD